MKVLLKNVRITFPNVYEARAVTGGDNPRYSASFLLEKGSENYTKLVAAMKEVALEKWGPKGDQTLKALVAGQKVCLRDGDTKADAYPYYAGLYFVSAANKEKPTVFDEQQKAIGPESGKPYSGCYVNASVSIWAQDNQYGKRINASLRGVQFWADGERLSGGGVATEDEFAEIPVPEGKDSIEDEDIFG